MSLTTLLARAHFFSNHCQLDFGNAVRYSGSWTKDLQPVHNYGTNILSRVNFVYNFKYTNRVVFCDNGAVGTALDKTKIPRITMGGSHFYCNPVTKRGDELISSKSVNTSSITSFMIKDNNLFYADIPLDLSMCKQREYLFFYSPKQKYYYANDMKNVEEQYMFLFKHQDIGLTYDPKIIIGGPTVVTPAGQTPAASQALDKGLNGSVNSSMQHRSRLLRM